jgi:hypothetical protein
MRPNYQRILYGSAAIVGYGTIVHRAPEDMICWSQDTRLLLQIRIKRLSSVYIALLLALLGVSACAQQAEANRLEPVTRQMQLLSQQHTLGQTFVAPHAGLAGIEVFLQPETTGTGTIMLHLRATPHTDTSLATASIPVSAITQPDFYHFALPVQPDSQQRGYYLLLELVGAGSVQVGTASGDAYLHGALYQDGMPLDAQMTFRLAFDPIQRIIGFITHTLPWWGLLLACGLALYVLPGYALLVVLWPDADKLCWFGQLALAAGLSLALYPVLFLLTHLVGLRLGASYAWIPPLVALAVLGWRYRRLRWGDTAAALRNWWQGDTRWQDAALLLVVVLVIATRLLPADALAAPMWADSYHHTVIARLLVDHNGLFNSWQPYAELETLTYHFGFHTQVAVFHWLTGITMSQATLWAGQLLNILAVLALYPLAVHLGKNRWAGVVAVLLAGLLSPMPMFYVNWGRYTQLAGQVVLPVAIYLVWRLLAMQQRDWRMLALCCLALSGLALTHYRVLIFALPFFLAFALVELHKEHWRTSAISILWLAFGCAVLLLPWFVHLFVGKIPSLLAAIAAASVSSDESRVAAMEAINQVSDLSPFLPVPLWLLLIAAICWAFWRHNRAAVLVSLWWFLVLLIVNPQWFGLPGAGAITNFALVLAAYMPAAVLIGAAAGWLATAGRQRSISGMGLALALLVGGLSVWGASQRLTDLQPENRAIVTYPDLRAAAWIEAQTPPQARFLVNFFFVDEATLAGADGGWWLPILAQRQTTLPPMLYIAERGTWPGYQQWVNDLAFAIVQHGIDHPTTLAMLRERGITHVYIGQRHGTVGEATRPALPVEQLLASPAFRTIYHEDRVWIFELTS